MKNKKNKKQLIILISTFLCLFVILFFNTTLEKANNNIIKNNTPIITPEPETKQNDLLDLTEEPIEEELNNFADTKIAKNKVITVEKIEKQMKVTAINLNVRSEAEVNNDNIIGILSEGDIVNVIGTCDNGWIEIEYNGSIGYTYEEYLKDF